MVGRCGVSPVGGSSNRDEFRGEECYGRLLLSGRTTVAFSRSFLLSLTVALGMGLDGCIPTPGYPPPSSFPGYPGGQGPGMGPSPRGRYGPAGLPSLSINPWKPSAPERSWTSIVIHHTASESGSVESIHEAHLRKKDKDGNPWLGIGYHFVIGNGSGMGDGEIEPTFRWRQQMHGAHAGDEAHNQHGIGIALVGNFDRHPPSPAQLASVKKLVATLKLAYGISSSSVVGHAEIKPTACPGKYFPMADVSQGVVDFQLTENHSGDAPKDLAVLQRSAKQ